MGKLELEMHGREPGEEFDDQPPLTPPRSMKAGGGIDISGMKGNIIVSAVVTIVILAFMTFAGGMGFVTKKDFTANIASVATVLEKANADLAKNKTEFDALLTKAKADIAAAAQSVPTTVSSQVSTAILQATGQLNSAIQSNTTALSQLISKVNDVGSQIVALKDSITKLETEVAGLKVVVSDQEERIAELETPPSSKSSSDPFTIESRIVSKTMSYSSTTGNTTVTFGVKLILTNKETRDLEDIELEVPLEVRVYALTGTGEIITWHDQASKWYLADMDKGYGSGEGVAYAILTGTDIVLDASEVDKITVPMTMLVKGNIQDFDVDINDDDIDITDWGYK